MKITKKHYFLIFLLLLLIVVLIRNYAIPGKSKPLTNTQKVIVPNREGRGKAVETDGSLANSRQREVESKEIIPFFEKRRDAARKVSTREDPFEPRLQYSAKSDKLTSQLENCEELTHNEKRPNSVRLVGVIADDTPLAILEVGKTSYIVSTGYSVAGMEVAEIRSDEIVLILENEERTIKLEEE